MTTGDRRGTDRIAFPPILRRLARQIDVSRFIVPGCVPFAYLVVATETLHLSLRDDRLLAEMGASFVLLVLAYSAFALLIGSSFRRLVGERAGQVAVAASFYVLLAIKMLAADANFITGMRSGVAFFVVSALLFAGVWWVERRRNRTIAFYVVVIAFLNLLKCLSLEWGRRGGRVQAFLTDWRSLAIVLGTFLLSVATVILERRFTKVFHGVIVLLAVVLTIAIGVIARPDTARPLAVSNPVVAGTRDFLIFSFDAWRKDRFDEQCAHPTDADFGELCSRSTHFENVVSSGLVTQDILSKNAGPGPGCANSLPGRLRQAGYRTAMYLGRKLMVIRGDECFDRYFSGGVRDIFFEGYALPAMLSSAMPSPDKNIRSKFVPTPDLIDRFIDESDVSSTTPQFAYMHMLDMHGPSVPMKLEKDPEFLRSVRDFAARCSIRCTASTDDPLLAVIKRGYDASSEDVERHIARLLRYLRKRGRPFRLVVTSDHGELFGEHGGIAHGGAFYQELISVPFIVFDSERSPSVQRDCRLMNTSEAISEAFGLTPPTAERASLKIDGPPLGTGEIDAQHAIVRFKVNSMMQSQAGTVRNLHTVPEGTSPFSLAHCD